MTSFRVWALAVSEVRLVLSPSRDPAGDPATTAEPHETTMTSGAGGWWETEVAEAGHGSDYGFRLDGGEPRPDPRSRWQPDGVHGLSRVYDPATAAWTDQRWRGMALAGAVLYELHVGTFTSGGTLDSAIERLDDLVDLGVDAVELLPLAAFNGPRGWGYDGVALAAVHQPYGGPEALVGFVDACHARGLGVVLDVVYNHLGPSGNHLAEFGPYFTDHHSTPWGAAVNLDAPGSAEVRRFLLDNAVGWLRDFHLDGLRLDAVHALVDDTATHLLEEMAVEVGSLAAAVRRPLSLVAESDLNDPIVFTPREAGGYGLTAQWCDDVHHAVHSTVTGERQGYYVDFGPLPVLAKALTGAFAHDGTWSAFRDRVHGRPVERDRTSGARFVTYLQDHDQVGNRATGDRITRDTPLALVLVGATLVLCSPFTPMVFMGEEWAASTPWCYFSSHPEPELDTAVREGRRREFASHGWAPSDVPDPQAESTFASSVLRWEEREEAQHAAVLDVYRRLIALRHATPELSDGRLDLARAAYDEEARWFVLTRGGAVPRSGAAAAPVGGVAVVCNLADERQEVPVVGTPLEVLLATESGFGFRDGSVDLPAQSAAVVRLLGLTPPPG